MKSVDMKNAISASKLDERLVDIYGKNELDIQKKRYIKAIENFEEIYGANQDISIFSVPGRSEISGNHTDHNNGKVLAAAIGLDIIAIVSPLSEKTIKVKSEGFDEDVVDISSLNPDTYANYSSASLIAGMCGGMKEYGYNYGGFVAYTTNNVYKGSGLSSSAAFEVMIGNILNHLYNEGKVDAPTIAKIAQYSENVYFGKPCGLMDQTACAVGGFVSIDFNDTKNPIIEQMPFDLTASGYSLCITNTGGNHADLNEDYASVPAEMKAVAKHFGKPVLRGIKIEEILSAVPALRKETGDRAILRAIHYINENERVEKQTKALKDGDVATFLDLVNQSGESSFMWLQNVFTTKNVQEQGVSLALAVSKSILKNCDKQYAVRVHGGGFAGTCQAFVPTSFANQFKAEMDKIFGENKCTPLPVRKYGAIKVI